VNDVDLQKKKTICLAMIWLIAIFIPLYWWHEPARQEAAIARIKKASMTRGAEIFVSHCVACHGKTGDNIPRRNLRRTPLEEAVLAKVISRGRPGTAMPTFGDEEGGSLKKFEIADVVAFIRNWDQSLFDAAATHLPPKTASSPGPGPTTSVAASKATATPAIGGDAQKGKTVYSNMGCAGCHGVAGQGSLGPPLKGKSASTIKKVVRSGREAMPSFDAASLSDADLENIIAFLVQSK
jgi:mono/diheme cytochrome c family protein